MSTSSPDEDEGAAPTRTGTRVPCLLSEINPELAAYLRRKAQLVAEQRAQRKTPRVTPGILERKPSKSTFRFESNRDRPEVIAAEARLIAVGKLPQNMVDTHRGFGRVARRVQEGEESPESSSEEEEEEEKKNKRSPFNEGSSENGYEAARLPPPEPVPVQRMQVQDTPARRRKPSPPPPSKEKRSAAQVPKSEECDYPDNVSIASDESFYSVKSNHDENIRENPAEVVLQSRIISVNPDEFRTCTGKAISTKTTRYLLQMIASNRIDLEKRKNAIKVLSELQMDASVTEGLLLSSRSDSLTSVTVALLKEHELRPEDEEVSQCLAGVLRLFARCLKASQPESFLVKTSRCVLEISERIGGFNLFHALLRQCDPTCRGDLPEDVARALSKDARKKSKAGHLVGVFVPTSEDLVDCKRAFERVMGVEYELPERGFMARFFDKSFCPVVHVVDCSEMPTPIEDVWAERFPDAIDKIPIEHDLPGEASSIYVKRIFPSGHALVYTKTEDQICALLKAIEATLSDDERGDRQPSLSPGSFVVVQRSDLVGNNKSLTVRFERARGVLLEAESDVAIVYLMDIGDVVEVRLRKVIPVEFGDEGGEPLVKFMRIGDLTPSASSGLYSVSAEILYYLTTASTMRILLSSSRRLPLTLKAMVKSGGEFPLRAALKILQFIQEDRHRDGRTLSDPKEGYSFALILLGVLRLPKVNNDALKSLYHVLDLMPATHIGAIYETHDVPAQMDEVIARCEGNDMRNLALKIKHLAKQNSVMLRDKVNSLMPVKSFFSYRRRLPMNGRDEEGDGGAYGRRMASGIGSFTFGSDKPRTKTPLGTVYKKFSSAPRPQQEDDDRLQAKLKELSEPSPRRPSQDARLEPPENLAPRQHPLGGGHDLDPPRHKSSDKTQISATHAKGVLMSIKDLPGYDEDNFDMGLDQNPPQVAKPSSTTSEEQKQQQPQETTPVESNEETEELPVVRRGDVLPNFADSSNCHTYPAGDLRDVDRDVLAKHMCGFLNTGRPAYILIGTEENSTLPVARGIWMSRKDKDLFRNGFDKFLNGDIITPRLLTECMKVRFLPLKKFLSERAPFGKERQMILVEVVEHGIDKVFKLVSGMYRGMSFVRDGNKTVEFTPQLMQKVTLEKEKRRRKKEMKKSKKKKEEVKPAAAAPSNGLDEEEDEFEFW